MSGSREHHILVRCRSILLGSDSTVEEKIAALDDLMLFSVKAEHNSLHRRICELLEEVQRNPDLSDNVRSDARDCLDRRLIQ